MNNRDVQDAFESGEPIDRAMDRAFLAAVRLHRLHGLPMVVWEDARVRQIDPFNVPLPEDEEVSLRREEERVGRARERMRRLVEQEDV